MEIYYSEQTTTTPYIKFNPDGNFYMKGISVPENPLAFYKPLFTWLKNFAQKPSKELNFVMYLEYLNTSSTRVLVDIIYELKEVYKNTNGLKLIWQFEKEDEDMKEFGEEMEILTNLKITFEELKR